MPLVTVAEVMRFALPAGATLQAGAGGLTSTVTWARLLRARPAALGRVERGEVWLLSSAAIGQFGDARAVARLIHDMAGAGVVAFLTSERLHADALLEAEQQ